MILNRYLLAIALLLPAWPAAAADSALGETYNMIGDAEAKIQEQVLDPMLGPGQAYVFLEAEAELYIVSKGEVKTGVGELLSSKADAADAGKDGEKTQKQTATQEKTDTATRDVYSLELRSMRLRILHDAKLPAEKLEAVKKALLALYPGRLKAADIAFVAAAMEHGSQTLPG